MTMYTRIQRVSERFEGDLGLPSRSSFRFNLRVLVYRMLPVQYCGMVKFSFDFFNISSALNCFSLLSPLLLVEGTLYRHHKHVAFSLVFVKNTSSHPKIISHPTAATRPRR